jgi:uncharacterized protein (TIGR03437 family)
MFRPLAVLTFLLAYGPAWAQDYLISTISGGAPPVTPAPAAFSSIGDPPRVAVDTAGNVYFASLHSVFKVDATGTLTRIAGSGRYGNSGDGFAATSAQLGFPEGIAIDSAGNVYVVDHDANLIRRITAAGAISTYAGTGTPGFAGDHGPAAAAQFRNPTGLAIDAADNLYVADTDNNVIRKISRDGTITTVAGNTQRGYGGDGAPATDAFLNAPEGMAVDAAGNLFIADTFNHRVRKVTPDGNIGTFAGNGYPGFSGDNNPAAGTTLQLPTDVAVDRQGRVYIADLGSSRIRMVSDGLMTTVAGSSSGIQPLDGEAATSVRLSGPTGVAVDAAGNLYIAEGSIGSGSGLDAGDFKIWKVSVAGAIFTLAGTGVRSFSGDTGPAALAQLDTPTGMAMDAAGNLYLADTANNRVRRISPDGTIVTVAGNGNAGFAGDGRSATAALLNHPMGLALDTDGTLYIADTGNNRVRQVSPAGDIGTWAGNGNAAYFGDGDRAVAAALRAPRAVALDAEGALYISDTENHRIRKVVNGMIETIAGSHQGFGGDGNPGTDALLNFPSALAIDPLGNVFIADQGNGRVRKLDPNGIITTVAGGDGSLTTPRALALDRAGNLYVSDSTANQVGRVTPDGKVTAVAGSGACCYANDGGPALTASLNGPWGLAADAAGRLYVADTGNDAIRLLQPAPTGGGAATVANGASNQPGPIAPGEIVAIFGIGLGPAQPVQFQSLNSLGLVSTELAGVSVLFNGIYAPVLYASATQVTVVVPYGASGSPVQIAVQYQSRIVLTTSAPLAPTAPAIFTADSSGKGQAVSVNQDGTANGPGHPAPAGSTVTLYATGEGQTSPAGFDGKPAGALPPHPVAPVSVTIGGQPATLLSAGGVPGMVAGIMQVTVKVPSGLAQAGPAPVVLQVGVASSPSGVTLVAGGM